MTWVWGTTRCHLTAYRTIAAMLLETLHSAFSCELFDVAVTTPAVSRVFSVELHNEWWMVDWKGLGRNLPWPDIGAVMVFPSRLKFRHSKVVRGDTHTQTATRSHKPTLFFFQNRESRLRIITYFDFMVFIPAVWLCKYILLVYRQHNNSVNDKMLTTY
jgi:hypothetical protein